MTMDMNKDKETLLEEQSDEYENVVKTKAHFVSAEWYYRLKGLK